MGRACGLVGLTGEGSGGAPARALGFVRELSASLLPGK